jgi:3-oxoacyl-[acyl-carrier protein] reductase
MDLNLHGKTALITGGSRGLGKQCAISLAQEGVNIAICGRTLETLNDTVEQLKRQDVKAIGIVADVMDANSLTKFHDETISKIGPVDILVNNAGGHVSRSDINEVSVEDFKSTFDLNLFSGFHLMQEVIPGMRNNHWGRIINIASIWGREYGGTISYMSSKAALIGATKHAAITLAKDGILVNSIAPGSIEHPGGSWERFKSENTQDVVDSFIGQNLPLGTFGWPEPLGDLVAFLSSDRAGLITGSCIVIDGGQSISMI